MTSCRTIWLGLGANVRGSWGAPPETLARALSELDALGLRIIAASQRFATSPVGVTRQPPFHNAVIGIQCTHSPFAVLLTLKRLERRAGRRTVMRWGPRPLDIDILDYRGIVVRRGQKTTCPGLLVLPHPQMHRRGFVLVPLVSIAPGWRHPLTKLAARDALKRSPSLRRGVKVMGPLVS